MICLKDGTRDVIQRWPIKQKVCEIEWSRGGYSLYVGWYGCAAVLTPFLTFWEVNTIFLGYFFSSTDTKTIFWGTKTTSPYKIRFFWPQIHFSLDLFGCIFQRPAITGWCEWNGMQNNPGKFPLMVMSSIEIEPVSITLEGNTAITSELCMKVLGILLGDRLEFSQHISVTYWTAAKQLTSWPPGSTAAYFVHSPCQTRRTVKSLI